MVTGLPCVAQPVGCIPPIRPFLPSDPRDVRAYADLLRQDFEAYIEDFDAYLRCLDAERARVFEEGQEVTQEYGRLRALTLRSRSLEIAD
ncbi:hypothetical protein FHG66_19320 [Rubellimicrobium rubrum]|uniref:Uncharacterized protein n=1 Tax=Rubellimicrobium rubrum TaxID=2585369 RepID=A0A5C4MLJ9_9RHOB|nr:hypothetical protein [Rubellimicrobium rubrum]TNC46188.1 hypothetical protein FHG66_19320 [Rubellimicrobium rubrum]